MRMLEKLHQMKIERLQSYHDRISGGIRERIRAKKKVETECALRSAERNGQNANFSEKMMRMVRGEILLDREMFGSEQEPVPGLLLKSGREMCISGFKEV